MLTATCCANNKSISAFVVKTCSCHPTSSGVDRMNPDEKWWLHVPSNIEAHTSSEDITPVHLMSSSQLPVHKVTEEVDVPVPTLLYFISAADLLHPGFFCSVLYVRGRELPHVPVWDSYSHRGGRNAVGRRKVTRGGFDLLTSTPSLPLPHFSKSVWQVL